MPQIPLGRPATYADLMALPEHLVAEILDDELHASPRPAPRHAWVASWVGGLLVPAYGRGDGGPGGWIVLTEPELHFRRDVLVPDLAGWRRERMPRLPETAYFALAPDWVCEVLSPSTATIDRAKKLRIYAREDVRFAWLVDPAAGTLEALQNDVGRWTLVETLSGDARVCLAPFDAVDIPLAHLWDETAVLVRGRER